MTVLGIDSSLTATGLAWPDSARTAKTRTRYWDRIEFILDQVGVELAKAPRLVVMEGPAFGAAGQSYHQTAGLWWLIAREVWRNGIPVAIAPPSSIKKFATGKGNADKDAMMLATARTFDWFDGDNNASDALWCAQIGYAVLGGEVPGRTKVNMLALDGLIWSGGPNDLYRFDALEALT